MMRNRVMRAVGTLLALLLAGSFGTAFAEGSTLPTIDEALKTASNSETGIIEVSDDLSKYDMSVEGEVDFGDIKAVVIQHDWPKKEFTEKDSGYPNKDPEGFPDNYDGVNLSETEHIWLRWDVMQQLPEQFRAKSMADADILIIAETYYTKSGSISVTDFEQDDINGIITPNFDTPQDLDAYLAQHPKKVTKITYYPTFAAVSCVNIYDVKTGAWSNWDYTYTPSKNLARNSRAQQIWSDMEIIVSMLSKVSEYPSSVNVDTITEAFKYSENIPETKVTFWSSCIEQKEYMATYASMEEYYWEMANSIAEADPLHAETIRMLASKKDYEHLSRAVELYDYSGFDTPIEEVKAEEDYLGKTDSTWFDTIFAQIIETYNG